MSKSFLEDQVGGDHYSKLGIQPVEYINANNLDYFQGNVIKYITRHKDKGGKEDVLKVIDYCKKIIGFQYGDVTVKDKYVNAGIKSEQEALERLINGEVFYSGCKIHFDHSKVSEGESPFRFGGIQLKDAITVCTKWLVKIEPNWYEDIPEQGVLCWCWNIEGDRFLSVIGHYYGNGLIDFEDDNGYKWKYAMPVGKGELENTFLHNQGDNS